MTPETIQHQITLLQRQLLEAISYYFHFSQVVDRNQDVIDYCLQAVKNYQNDIIYWSELADQHFPNRIWKNS